MIVDYIPPRFAPSGWSVGSVTWSYEPSAAPSASATRLPFLVGVLVGLVLAFAIVATARGIGHAAGRAAAGVGGNVGAPRLLTPVADAPKMTKAWRCKRRGNMMFCHTYRAGLKAFGEAARQLRPPVQIEPWSRRWCLREAPCAPLVTDL